MRAGINLVLTVLEAPTCQYERQVSGRMSPGCHSAPIEDGCMIEQGASIDGIFLGLQEVDQIRHHGNLKAFDLLEGGHRFLTLPMVGKPVVAAVEAEVPVGETTHASDGTGRVGLEGKCDDFDHGLELLGGAVARFGLIDRGFWLGPIDPGFLLLDLSFKSTNRIEVLLQFRWSCLPSSRLRDLAWSMTTPKILLCRLKRSVAEIFCCGVSS